MFQRLAGAALLLSLQTIANAHFVFVVPQAGGSTAQVIVSEDLKPSQEVDAGLVKGAKLTLRDREGRQTVLSLSKSDAAYITALPGGGTRLVYGIADLGVMQRGEGKPNLLIYYPKTILGDPFDPKTLVGEAAPVEIVPTGKAGSLRLKVIARGNPLANGELTVIFPDGTQKVLKTDQAGQTEELKQSGRFGAWARYWETKGGERDGKKYEEVRHYATLVIDVASAAAPTAASTASTSVTARRLANLTEATSAFGAVASDGWLYVYGGHIAPTHSYSSESVSGRFSRLRLSGQRSWEQLPAGPPAQGMNLAAHGGKIYRIGGMAPRNKPGTKAETYSFAESARFDPAAMKWEPLPALPHARSSHDVVVVGSKLIVLGGWTLRGPEPTQWRDTVEVLDLAAGKLEWKSFKQPFTRRALIAASHAGKVYVMGGFDENSQVVTETSIYDPASDVWTKGPTLPGSAMESFAPAACVHEQQLYVSIGDGSLHRLNEAAKQWEKAGTATPRIAHRLAPDGKTILVIGGAAKGNNLDLIEAVTPSGR